MTDRQSTESGDGESVPDTGAGPAAAESDTASEQTAVLETEAGSTDTDAGTGTDPVGDDAALTEVTIEPKPARRRRIGTTPLFVGALAIGVVGGLAAGYAVQATRTPTPLAPLAAPQPHYVPGPVFTGVATKPLPASQDDATIVDGDLTKLLLPTPSGAKVGLYDHQFLTLEEDSQFDDDPGTTFTADLSDGIVRIADTDWTLKNGVYEEIEIFQYAPGESANAMHDFNQDVLADGSTPLTATGDSGAMGYQSVDDNGAYDEYMAAVHGDLILSFFVTSPSHYPPASDIQNLVASQMARL